jgi:hypothetical protein
MRKVNVLEFVSLDGVIQAPGGPEEDTSGGFAYGGWISPHSREKQNLQDDSSNSGTAVRLYAKGRATSPPEDRYRRIEKPWRSI